MKKIKLSHDGFRRWDIIKNPYDEYIILNKDVPGDVFTNYTVYPHEKQDTALGQFIWFQLLKLLYFLHLL